MRQNYQNNFRKLKKAIEYQKVPTIQTVSARFYF